MVPNSFRCYIYTLGLFHALSWCLFWNTLWGKCPSGVSQSSVRPSQRGSKVRLACRRLTFPHIYLNPQWSCRGRQRSGTAVSYSWVTGGLPEAGRLHKGTEVKVGCQAPCWLLSGSFGLASPGLARDWRRGHELLKIFFLHSDFEVE